jgi:hypothetical protein
MASFVDQWMMESSDQMCHIPHHLFCLQVGSGGPANDFPALPIGAKRVFTTRTEHAGDFAAAAGPNGAHDAADALCDAEATSVGLSGKYRAWLATSAVSAPDYFHGLGMDGPWYRMDDILVARALADLTSGGTLESHLNVGPDSSWIPIDGVWTGTDATGGVDLNCTDFTVADSGQTGRAGRAFARSNHWTYRQTWGCNYLFRLYCFEQ